MTEKIFIKYFSVAVFLTLFVIHDLKAGNFGEHKLIGDSAFKKCVAGNPELAGMLHQLLGSVPLKITSDSIPIKESAIFYKRSRYDGQYPLFFLKDKDGKDKAVTYGDLTALSGDHFDDYIDEFSRFFTEEGVFRSTGVYTHLFEKVLCEYRKELDNLNEGNERGRNFYFIPFIHLAIQDRSHFHIPAMPLRQEIDAIGLRAYDHATDLFFGGASGDEFSLKNNKKILTFFEANSVAKYSILHMMAKTYYIQMHGLLEMNTEESLQMATIYLRLALFANAFSEHYLQDMFAAGHFFADRNDSSDVLGLEAKGIHDFFGRHGLQTFVDGKPIRLMGDNRYTPDQLNMAITANIASLEDLFGVDVSLLYKPKSDYLEMLQNPAENPAALFPALKLVPEAPLGERYFSQRKVIGSSISGLNYGVYGLGSQHSPGFFGTGVTGGLNFLFAPSDTSKKREGNFGFGINALFEVTADRRNTTDQIANGRIGLGASLFLWDKLYGSASITSTPFYGLAGKFEQGIQIKPLKWKYGFHIGIVEYASRISPYSQLSISIIHY